MKTVEPDLELKKDIDLGLILDTTAPVQLFIPIKNKSNRTITILKIAKDCSCISVTIDKRNIEPGGTAMVRYSANIYGKSGQFASDILIESDASERFNEIQIRGQITGQIRVRPLIVTVLTGEHNSPGRFTVFCDDQDGEWAYRGFASDNAHITLDLQKESSTPTTSIYNGVVSVAREKVADAGLSYSEAGVTLKFQNTRQHRELNINIPIQIGVRRAIVIDPACATFLAKGGEQKRTLLIQSAQELSLDAVRPASPAIQTAIHRVNPYTIKVELIYHPGSEQQEPFKSFSCDLIDKGSPIGSIPVNIMQIP